ncbi:MAG: hypothetical protein LBQ60_21025 [Bacteroidales bacterium]|jgi:hypothetical protein|nr:hypothetical protein [Bacteroidales bacterium]
MRKFIFLLILIPFFYSCKDKAYIKIQNKVRNATLNNVSWDNNSIAYSLLPGEVSEELKIVDDKDDFPKRAVVKFYMQGAENQVYLQTKYSFSLDAGQTLLIVISDTTSVINPITE